MSVFSTADRDAVAAAIVTATVAGFASVSISGQTITKVPLRDLMAMLDKINADLASDQTHFGLRMVTLVPPGAG